MPVENVDMNKMGEEFLTLLDSAETTSDLWVENTSVIAWGLIAVIFLATLLAILFFTKGFIARIFNR